MMCVQQAIERSCGSEQSHFPALFLLHDLFKFGDQFGKIIGEGVPDAVKIDVEIYMDEAISH
jgi:hypothetical protein